MATQQQQWTGDPYGGSSPLIEPYTSGLGGSGGSGMLSQAALEALAEQYGPGSHYWDLVHWNDPSPAPDPILPEPEFPYPITEIGSQPEWPRYEFPNFPTLATPQLSQIPQHDWIAEAQRLGKVKQIQDVISQLETGLGPIRSTLGELLAISPEAIEERYRAEIETPATRYFQEQTMPSLRRSFVGPGTFWSSMRAGAEQRAGTRLSEALMGERSRMYGQAREQALAATRPAMELEQQAFAGRTYPFETALKAAPLGTQQRAQDLQRELNQAQLEMQGRVTELQRVMELEKLKQRERETWGYLSGAEAGGMSYPYQMLPQRDEPRKITLGAAL